MRKQWEVGEEEYGKLKSDIVVRYHGGSLVVIRGECSQCCQVHGFIHNLWIF